MALNGLSVSIKFIQYSVVNTESKFETRKFDRERKRFVPFILNNAFLEPGCFRLTWPMITRQTRARKQNGNLLRKNSWTTGSILVFLKVCTCEVFFMLKDFIKKWVFRSNFMEIHVVILFNRNRIKSWIAYLFSFYCNWSAC